MGKEGIEIKISTLPVIGLTLIFAVLKLFKVIAWPWIWVLSPVWITVGIAFLFIAIAVVALFMTGTDEFLSHWGDDE